jgi:hypothetical protein
VDLTSRVGERAAPVTSWPSSPGRPAIPLPVHQPIIALRGATNYLKVIFTVVYIQDPKKGQELISTFTQDEAFERICPFSMADGGHRCKASECMGWKFLPGQHDARVARGFCGMAA